ncbi:HupE/UreJ family protein [Synechococcus sp. CS-1328]|uniref:HupE/UreJ family protein n=1 Tax=Synechococcus sp. CS-1328 TaxID=2847976 RepID=UPI00223B4A4F|nr:HupE/UreJ family protein [Synechococcus sp. CS-1328]MCT0224903.1 HupE/UreJ family protein [Synechococcus sp. CS-1328]
MRRACWLSLARTAAVGLSPPAWAHAESGHGGGFVAGFLHPIAGLDHVVAMVAVGLWGAVLGPPALGVLLGETRRWPGGRSFVRTTGGGVTLVGLWFLERALT